MIQHGSLVLFIFKNPILFLQLIFQLIWINKKLNNHSSFKELVQEIHQNQGSRHPKKHIDIHKAFRCAAAVDRRIFGHSSCLRVALVIYKVFPGPLRLKIGVRKQQNLEAHAWIEDGNNILSVSNMDDYQEIVTFEKDYE